MTASNLQSLNQVRMSTVSPDDIAVDAELEEEYSSQTDSEEDEIAHNSIVVLRPQETRQDLVRIRRLRSFVASCSPSCSTKPAF